MSPSKTCRNSSVFRCAVTGTIYLSHNWCISIRYKLKVSRPFLIAGILGPLVALSLTVLDTAISPWFTWTGNALSDLGVHEYSYLFNYSLIFEGIMNFFFAFGLYQAHGIRKSTVAFLMISGFSLSMVGIFVETYHIYHLTFALIYFILFPISIILFSRQISTGNRSQAAVGYLFAAISLITIVIGILIDFGALGSISLGLAIPEVIEAVLLGAWSIYISVWTLAGSRRRNTEPLPE